MHIFFTDLDGTLLNSQKLIDEKTMEAIKAYVNAGHIFVISSGRPISSIEEGVIKRAGLSVPNLVIISNNGSLIYDYEKQKNLMEFRMPKEDILHIIDTARDMGLHCQTYCDGKIICRESNPGLELYIRNTRMVAEVHENIDDYITEDPYKALAICLEGKERLLQLRDKLADWMEGRYTSLFSCNEYIEFIDIRSGKGNAVKNVCDFYGISVEDAYAAGDENNDLTMLSMVGNSIAMKNAIPDVKAICKFETERDNDHDGLADILLKLSADPA